MELLIFELADVATILGLEKSLVKNWTIGRPFSITPSIQEASGKGSRNLFSVDDLCCFSLVHRLNEAGAPVASIKKILEEVQSHKREQGLSKGEGWLFVNRAGRAGLASAIASCKDIVTVEPSPRFAFHPEDEIGFAYGVSLMSLATSVSKQIDAYIRKRDYRRTRGRKGNKTRR